MNVDVGTTIASLFLFHTPSNGGYAIARAEELFYEVGMELAGSDESQVHFGFRDLETGPPLSLPPTFKNAIAYDYSKHDPQNIRWLADYVRKNGIRLVVMYDVQPIDPLFKALHSAGVRAVVSYWGAAISSPMPLWKLILKRAQIVLSASKVDGLIFQSQAMADLALYGRGVPPHMVDVVYSGADISVFKPTHSDYVYRALNLPRDKKVFVYSGHMEGRKGVGTLIEAAIELLHRRKRTDLCFLLCGNRDGESQQYEVMYADLGINDLIRFAGYRADMDKIYPSCFCGIIPSSGWDSFPRSAIEMAAAGLPVIASALGGLPEAVKNGETGLLFQPGMNSELVACIETLLDKPGLAAEYGARGRRRCEEELNSENQKRQLRDVFLKRLGMSLPLLPKEPEAGIQAEALR